MKQPAFTLLDGVQQYTDCETVGSPRRKAQQTRWRQSRASAPRSRGGGVTSPTAYAHRGNTPATSSVCQQRRAPASQSADDMIFRGVPARWYVVAVLIGATTPSTVRLLTRVIRTCSWMSLANSSAVLVGSVMRRLLAREWCGIFTDQEI